MMFKLSFISLFLLFVTNTLGITTELMTSGSTTDSSPRKSLNSMTTPSFKTTSNLHTTSKSKTTSNLPMISNMKMISNAKTTQLTTVSPKIVMTRNGNTMKSGSTTLNPMVNIHFLLYILCLLFCVCSGWSGFEWSALLAQFITICWITTSMLRKSNLFQFIS